MYLVKKILSNLIVSKQLLSMEIINQEQLDNFVFNYGK